MVILIQLTYAVIKERRYESKIGELADGEGKSVRLDVYGMFCRLIDDKVYRRQIIIRRPTVII